MHSHPVRAAALLALAFLPVLLSAQTDHSRTDASAAPTVVSAPPLIDGVTVSGVMKNELWNVLGGGVQHGNGSIAHGELYVTADMERMIGVPRTQMYFQLIGNNGGGISARSGDMQMVSNLEGYRTFKVYQWWLGHDIPAIGASFLFGLYDLNSEFYVTPSSALFLNGSHGVGIDLGQTGANGPSVYPNTALAFRARFAPSDRFTFSAAVVDGHPGAADDCNRFDLTVSKAEGFLLITEAAYAVASSAKAGIGTWYYTGGYADACPVTGDPIIRRDNAGVYMLGDLQLSDAFTFFARGGVANQHVNAVQYHFGSGVSFTGPWDSRPDDVVGFAVALASFGPDFRAFGSAAGEEATSSEWAHELTYRAVVAPWLALQGDVQYIVHPSGSSAIHHTLVAGMRMELDL